MRQAIGAQLTHQHPGLDQRAHALFQEKGIAGRARDQQLSERRQAGVVAQERLEDFRGTRRGQGVEPQLRVVGLAAPAVLILGPIVDQEQNPGRGQTLDQAVEQGLGLGVDPVQVLEDQQQRLHLAFAQQQTLERRERALAALGRIELVERAVIGQHVKEREERRQRVLEGFVQRSAPGPSPWHGWCARRRCPRRGHSASAGR